MGDVILNLKSPKKKNTGTMKRTSTFVEPPIHALYVFFHAPLFSPHAGTFFLYKIDIRTRKRRCYSAVPLSTPPVHQPTSSRQSCPRASLLICILYGDSKKDAQAVSRRPRRCCEVGPVPCECFISGAICSPDASSPSMSSSSFPPKRFFSFARLFFFHPHFSCPLPAL